MKKILSIMAVMLVEGLIFSHATNQPTTKVEVIETQKIEEQVHILTDEELSKLYTCKQDVRKSSSEIVELDQKDAWLLMQLSRCEAGDCGVDAQYLTMMVVMNRLWSDEFPNDIYSVIYQRNADGTPQFAVIDDGKLSRSEPNADSHLALARIEQGEDASYGALYFEASTNSSESWHSQNKEFLYECYGQRYYK